MSLKPGMKTKQFIYRNSLKWVFKKKGLLSSPGRPDIEIATPAEFKGHAGIWTPEDLFVASVNACIMTTFLHFAQRDNFNFLSYASEAEGVLERIENKFMFSEVKIMPKVTVASSGQVEKAKELMELTEKSCLVSNSIKSKVTVNPEIKIEA